MRWFRVGAAVLAASAIAAPPARAGLIVNSVSNGSFESGFAGWTVTSSAGASNPGKGPQIVVTNGSTADEYGDKEVADNAATPDPDGAGTHAVYLVDDTATETLTQMLVLQPGIYEVGFDLLATGSGAGNKYDSTLSAVIAGVSVLSASVSEIIASDGTNTWTHYSANADILEAGTYEVAFSFVGGAAPAKDVMLDQVYVETPTTIAAPPVPVPVPEPQDAALFGAGLACLALLRLRRPEAASARRRDNGERLPRYLTRP